MADAPKPGSVLLSGATGSNADKINGIFEPTSETCDNLPVYKKKDTKEEIWLEFNKGLSYWFIRSTSNRGTNVGWSYCAVSLPCLPQGCPASKWQIYNGKEFETVASLRVLLLSGPPQHLQAMADNISSVIKSEVFFTIFQYI